MPDESGADTLVTLALAHVEMAQSPDVTLRRVGIAIEPAKADEPVSSNRPDQTFARPTECVRSGGPIVREPCDEAKAVACGLVFQRAQPGIQARDRSEMIVWCHRAKSRIRS